MPETGKVITYTKAHSGPAIRNYETPYNLALIELTNGMRVFSQVVGEEISIGAKVGIVFRKILEQSPDSIIHYGYKFKVINFKE